MKPSLCRPFRTALLLWLGFACRVLADDPAPVVVALTAVPAPAQKAIQLKVGEGQLGEILRSTEDGETIFDVEVTKNKHTRSYSFNDRGDLLEEEVLLPELSPRLRKAIHAQLGPGQLEGIYKSTDEGEVTYEVEFTREGKPREFTLGSTGRLLSTLVYLEELSAELQAAIKKAAVAGSVESIYKNTEEEEVLYEVDMKAAGKTRTLTFDTKGQLVSEEQSVALSDTPATVQQALAVQCGPGGKVLSLSRTTEKGEVTYDADVLRDGKTQSLTLAADGKVQP